MNTNNTWESPLVAIGANSALRDGCRVLGASVAVGDRYRALRERVAVSDFCYFSKFVVRGPRALEIVNRAVVADIARLPIRRMVATFMLREDASPLADAYVINDGESYTVFAEGASAEETRGALCGAGGDTVVDLTQDLALLSVDGPYGWECMKDLVGVSIVSARYLDVVPGLRIADVAVTVYRAGKTGEFGYLIAVPAVQVAAVFEAVTSAAARYEGLICEPSDIDTCKLENRVVNMAREGRLARNVLELNCRVMVSSDKGDYAGRGILHQALDAGAQRRVIGIRAEAPGQTGAAGFESGVAVLYKGARVGEVVNAGYSDLAGHWIATALLDDAYAHVGLEYELDGGMRVRTVSAPFVQNKSLSIRPQEDSFFARV